MNLLDVRTVLVGYAISNSLCALVIWALWQQHRRRSPELKFWLADFIMQLAAIILVVLRGVIAEWASIMLSGPLMIGGTVLLFIGLERYVGQPGAQRHNIVLVALFTVVHAYFTFAQPSLLARNINVSIGLLIICAQCAWLMLRRVKTSLRSAARPVGVAFGLYSAVSLARVFADAAVPPGNDLFQSGLYDTLVVLIYQMLFIALTFALVLMVNRRLLAEQQFDHEQRRDAEQALIKSQEKFLIAFHNIPDALVITAVADGRIIEVNDSFFRLSEFTREDIADKTTLDLNLWGRLADRERFVELLRQQTRVLGFETTFRRKSGALFPGLISGEIIQLPEGRCVLNVIRDITAPRRAEDLIRARLDLFDFAATHSLAAVLQHTLDRVGALTGSPIGFYHFVERDQRTLSLQAWSTRTLQEFCQAEGQGLHYPLDLAGVWVDCVLARRPVVHNDYAALPHRKGLPAGHAPVTRELVVPILRDDQVVAILGVGNKPVDYTDDDVELVAYFADVAWEIADRKRTEAERERLLHVLDASLNEVYIFSPETLLLQYVNTSAVHNLGYTRDRLQTLTPLDLKPEMTPAAFQELLQPLLRGEKPRQVFQTIHRRADGSLYPVEVQLQLVHSDAAPVFLAIIVDITERKQQETRLLAAHTELQRLLAEADQSRRVLLSVVEDQKMAAEALQASNQRLSLLNRVALALAQTRDMSAIARTAYEHLAQTVDCPCFGISLYDEATTTLRAEYMLCDGDLLPADRFPPLVMAADLPQKGRAGALLGRRPEIVNDLPTAPEQTVLVGQAGDARLPRSALYMPLIVHGQLIGLLELQSYREHAYGAVEIALLGPIAHQLGLAIENVRLLVELQAERNSLAQRVDERTAQLQAANRELETFAYSVSHDLRAPLRSIDGWSLALLEDYGGQLDASARQYLDRVRGETQRMGQLIDDILRLSRVSRLDMQPGPVDLSALAQVIIKRLQDAQPNRRFDFRVQPGLQAWGDRNLLEIALVNLLDNAAKFTGPRPVAQIEFGLAHVDGRTAYYIRDNGVGFDMTYAKKLFGAFQRMHRPAEFPGTGIGLATVQRIIHRHGGVIWADARRDEGATFYFTLEVQPYV